MPRLIDADALIAKNMENVESQHNLRVAQLLENLVNAPTIEAEPVMHGRWIKRPDERICPFCNTRYSYFGGEEKNYCPNCGADMRGD